MNNEEIKNLVSDAAKEVFDELKNNCRTVVSETIMPGITEAKESFVTELKAEASATSSPWVKIRSYGIVGIVEIIAKIIEKVVNKAAIEEPKTVEVAAPVETIESTTTEQVVQ